MKKHPLLLVSPALALAAALAFATSVSSAAPQSVVHNGKTYYKVNAADASLNSGKKVCAAVGRSCVGYTALHADVCLKFHPTAKKLISVNGSKAGFYCDGLPQKGLACEKMKNTCEVCPACNLNVDCNTDITSMNQFRETFIECGPLVQAKSSSKAKISSKPASKRSTPTRSAARSQQASSKKTGGYGPLPGPSTKSAPSNAGNAITCTFTQTPKKVTCGAYKAGDTFCALSMGNVNAKATLCQDTGKIVCTLPCTAQGASTFQRCATGGVKAGSCAAPVPAPTAKKRVGEKCVHGGECNTTFCVGVPDYYKGMQYFCSCSQWKMDTTCGK